MIALVDYGAGNLQSVRKALRACGAEVFEPSGADRLALASAIVLPGVGHFAAMTIEVGSFAVRQGFEIGQPMPRNWRPLAVGILA